jgi:hypothetical protein
LALGEGSKLPDPETEGQYNLVWWNATDYSDPTDDPYKEIVRVTAKSGDEITILRGQEGTTAQNHNLSGKSYKMMLTLTKKTYEDLQTIEVYKDGTLVGQRARLNFKNFDDISDDEDNQRINLNLGNFRIDDRFGDGSDGDLIISTGTTNLDFQNQIFLKRQYRNLSITGNAILSFVNPNNNGSVAIIYVADTATITSSEVAIDLSGMGAKGATSASSSGLNAFQTLWKYFYGAQGGGAGTSTSGGSGGTGIEGLANTKDIFTVLKEYVVSVGSGGGSGSVWGSASAGLGGRGGGGLILIANKLNFSSSIYANGLNGSNGTGSSGSNYAAGGGGGGGGFIILLARNFLNLSGSLQAKGGNGGNGFQGDTITSSPYYGAGGGGACAGNGGNGHPGGAPPTGPFYGDPGQNGVVVNLTNFSITTNVSGGSGGQVSGSRKVGGGGGGGGGYILIAKI